MKKFNVGDVVWLRPGHHGGPHRRTIAKVGHKYAYLDGDPRNYPYDLETGRQSDPYSKQFTQSAGTIYTLAEWEAKTRRDAVTNAIREHKISFPAWGQTIETYSVEKLEKLLAVLNEDI